MADINYLAIQKAELARIIEGHDTHHPTSNACYICYLIKCRSGEMADTSDLKSDGVAPHESSSLSSGNTDEALIELRRAHEALLTTLAASTHSWIHKVHKNAKAYYITLKEKYKWK